MLASDASALSTTLQPQKQRRRGGSNASYMGCNHVCSQNAAPWRASEELNPSLSIWSRIGHRDL